jgi:hypothetical protein
MKKLDRNPQPVLDAVCKVWKKYPDLRVGQIIANATRIKEDDVSYTLFYLENLELAAAIMDTFGIEDD